MSCQHFFFFYIAQSVISDDRLRRSLSLAGPHVLHKSTGFIANVTLAAASLMP